MIVNIFKRCWITESMLNALRCLPDQFSVYMLTHQNDRIPISVVTGTERWVKAIQVEFMDGRKSVTYTISERFPEVIMVDIDRFVEQYAMLNQPNKADLQQIQSAALQETVRELGIDNNIDNQSRQLTFHLNDYTQTEREKIIAYLQVVDFSTVDISINADFSRCTKEQMERNSDFLILANAATMK